MPIDLTPKDLTPAQVQSGRDTCLVRLVRTIIDHPDQFGNKLLSNNDIRGYLNLYRFEDQKGKFTGADVTDAQIDAAIVAANA